jgi:EAL domain-containing protein (putative c-di-GMP-specific phosphodiesterase class I)
MLQFLRDFGCDEGQGYLLASPLSAEKLEAFLSHSALAIPTRLRSA